MFKFNPSSKVSVDFESKCKLSDRNPSGQHMACRIRMSQNYSFKEFEQSCSEEIRALAVLDSECFYALKILRSYQEVSPPTHLGTRPLGFARCLDRYSLFTLRSPNTGELKNVRCTSNCSLSFTSPKCSLEASRRKALCSFRSLKVAFILKTLEIMEMGLALFYAHMPRAYLMFCVEDLDELELEDCFEKYNCRVAQFNSGVMLKSEKLRKGDLAWTDI